MRKVRVYYNREDHLSVAIVDSETNIIQGDVYTCADCDGPFHGLDNLMCLAAGLTNQADSPLIDIEPIVLMNLTRDMGNIHHGQGPAKKA